MRRSGIIPQTGELFHSTRVSRREYMKSTPKNIFGNNQLKKGTERRCTDEADSEVLRGSVCELILPVKKENSMVSR